MATSPDDEAPVEVDDDLTPPPRPVPRSPIEAVRVEIADERAGRIRGDARTHKRVDAVERKLLVIGGVEDDATGGEVGKVRGRLGLVEKVLIGIATLAIGSLGTAMCATYNAGDQNGEQRQRIQRLEAGQIDHEKKIDDLRVNSLRRFGATLRWDDQPQPPPADAGIAGAPPP